MKQPNYNLTLSMMMLACASGGLPASANAQGPATAVTAPIPPGGTQTVGAATSAAGGGHLTDRPEDEKAIKRLGETFTRAFDAGDAKTVAELYSDDAEMIDEYGDRIQGRPAIHDFYAELFAERKGATIEIFLASLRFLGAEGAQENGRTRVKPGNGEPTTYREYTVLYVKKAGQWLYSSVREEHPTGLAHQEHLNVLAWLVGEWMDESSDSMIHARCHWSDDKNFLLRDFVIHVEGKPVMNVTQRIGWDPLSRQIKSWVFDSDGGYGEALWTRNGNQWLIKSNGVLPDGRIATATNVLTRTGPNGARWASIQRTIGGQVAADHRESVMVRRPPQPQTESRPK
jgi:uncharacterized protein (TIGR02246 family)